MDAIVIDNETGKVVSEQAHAPEPEPDGDKPGELIDLARAARGQRGGSLVKRMARVKMREIARRQAGGS